MIPKNEGTSGRSASDASLTRPVDAQTNVAHGESPPDDLDDDYYDEEAEYDCTHCGGEGYREVDDPLWDDCDEFGYGPCSSCRGTGLRSKQWVF